VEEWFVAEQLSGEVVSEVMRMVSLGLKAI
jgi:hypothetical protein